MCVHTCYVDCALAHLHDRLTGVHFAMWYAPSRSLYHAPQADAKKRASADQTGDAKRGPGRPRQKELPAEVNVAIEAMVGAAAADGDPDYEQLFGCSQPGTPATAAAPDTPVGVPTTPLAGPAPTTPVRPDAAMAPPTQQLHRASTQVVACSVIHSCM